MTQRILELAKECGITEWYIGNDDAKTARQLRHCEQLVAFYLTAYADCAKHYERKDEDLEKFRTAAYQAGEAAMRERAAAECERMMVYPNARQESAVYDDVWKAAKGIRNLDIET